LYSCLDILLKIIILILLFNYLLLFTYIIMPEKFIAWFDWSLLETLWFDIHTMWVGGWLWLLFTLICLWRVFNKAGQSWWKSIIPFYNVYIWFKIAGRSGWWVLSLIFAPLFAIMMIISYFDVSKRFWHCCLFALWLLFLNPIFLAILSFWGDKYSAK